jgi:hypothetical protein
MHEVETHVITQDQGIQNCAFASKMMLILLWDFNGPILEHYLDCAQMVNSAQYCATLKEEVKPAVHSESREMLTNGVVLHNDNTQPYTAAAIIEAIQKPKFTLLHHPAYSPHLTPSDYHIFGLLKDALCGHLLADNEDFNDVVHMALYTTKNIPCQWHQEAHGSK